jgi:hypothetical protein
MKTYEEKIGAKIYRYYYDNKIKFWTVYQINETGDQITEPEYFNDRDQLKAVYPFKFKA